MAADTHAGVTVADEVRAAPGSTLIRCPVCRLVVYIERANDPRSRGDVAADVETTCRDHLAAEHRLRLWLYDWFEWKWLLRGPR